MTAATVNGLPVRVPGSALRAAGGTTAVAADPILTPNEHRLLHAAFDTILAESPHCPNCGRPKLTADLGDNTEETP